MTGCICQYPGYCERHQCRKSDHWHQLCRTEEDYFRLWEEGRGPGQSGELNGNAGLCHGSLTLLMVTYNRLEYTRQALEALLSGDHSRTEIIVWDNASTDGTREWLLERLAGLRQVRLILSGDNLGSVHPMNIVWGSSSTEFVAKVDNDTLIRPDLLSRLSQTLSCSDRLGVVSGCHFRTEDLPPDLSTLHKAHSESAGEPAAIWQQPNVGGCAVMMRRELFETFGPIPTRRAGSDRPYLESGWTQFQRRLHQAGFTNGYPLPLSFVDHMEDARSKRCIRSGDHQAYKSTMRGMSLQRATDRIYSGGAAKYFSDGEYRSLTRDGFAKRGCESTPLTLFVPLAGRTAYWPRLSAFLDRQTYPHDRIRLLLCDTSQDSDFSQAVRRWMVGSDYRDVRHCRLSVGRSGLADEPRRDVDADVKGAMARIYNWLRTNLSTEFVWILEDDLLPPDDVCGRLFTHFDERTVSVAAPYRSRFADRFIVWDKASRNVISPPKSVTQVGGNGFGCVVIRGIHFRSIPFPADGNCDREFYQRLSGAHLNVKVDWTCLCQHGDEPVNTVRARSRWNMEREEGS